MIDAKGKRFAKKLDTGIPPHILAAPMSPAQQRVYGKAARATAKAATSPAKRSTAKRSRTTRAAKAASKAPATRGRTTSAKRAASKTAPASAASETTA